VVRYVVPVFLDEDEKTLHMSRRIFDLRSLTDVLSDVDDGGINVHVCPLRFVACVVHVFWLRLSEKAFHRRVKVKCLLF